MKINYGEKEVLESKSFMTLGLGETRLTIGEADDILNFVLEFIKTDDGKPDFKINQVDVHTLNLRFVNWDDPIGITLNEPIPVGSFRGRTLYILVYVKKAGSKNEFREVIFTAYLGERTQDGAN